MTRWQPECALARLTAALEAEILAAPAPEVRSLVGDAMARADLRALRARVVRAIEAAEEGAIPAPRPQGGSALRRS